MTDPSWWTTLLCLQAGSSNPIQMQSGSSTSRKRQSNPGRRFCFLPPSLARSIAVEWIEYSMYFYPFAALMLSHACIRLDQIRSDQWFIYLPVCSSSVYLISLTSSSHPRCDNGAPEIRWTEGASPRARRHVDPAAPPPTGTLTQCGPAA